MMHEYKIVFTPLAKAFAEAHYSVADVEKKVREEIDEMLRDGLRHVSELFFHTVSMSGDYNDGRSFICTPGGNGELRVDTATYEEMDSGPLKEGPFKGKTFSMPRGDTDDDPS